MVLITVRRLVPHLAAAVEVVATTEELPRLVRLVA
jgi:hypothetical protein